ncbi:MAG: aminotransferase class I/II-fold pyridoxal phosphate-dependent enzyme [Pseudomonadota bacterium]
MLERRGWVPEDCENRVQDLAAAVEPSSVVGEVERLAAWNTAIHASEAFNLNPAANVMNPRAEALLSAGLGSRPSLGYPGDKYEMGLEAVEEIEVIAAEMAARVFHARFAEVRVFSGAMANLYAFMALTEPGDTILVPPASVGGHVTHHVAGAAGLYRLNIVEAPVDVARYSVDVEGLAALAREVRPKLITLGGSLNLQPHPVAEVAEIAREVGAKLLFDAAHQCGLIAGGVWEDPLALGADVMTMSTYKSLGGPAGGLIVTNNAGLAERIDAIAFPGLTANFDVGRVAALAIGLVDWVEHGQAYAQAMVETAQALAEALLARGMPVFNGGTASHQFALEAATFGSGHRLAKHLRKAGLLTSGIGLPVPEVAGDANGLRLGTPEAVRWGAGPQHAEVLAGFIVKAAHRETPEDLAAEVASFRAQFDRVRFVCD